jgi:hypothetical protein
LKSVDRIYQQTFVDPYPKMAFAQPPPKPMLAAASM